MKALFVRLVLKCSVWASALVATGPVTSKRGTIQARMPLRLSCADLGAGNLPIGALESKNTNGLLHYRPRRAMVGLAALNQ